MQRAAVSIPSNIAEGRQRNHTKEFMHFLSISKGSLAELETLILLSQRLKFITESNSEVLLSKAAEIGRMITGLERTLSKRL
jgi:four helix bundle protein